MLYVIRRFLDDQTGHYTVLLSPEACTTKQVQHIQDIFPLSGYTHAGHTLYNLSLFLIHF